VNGGRPHFTIGVPGWEAVADYALRWATENAVTDPRGAGIPATTR
jgi:hypothetical protein